MGILTGKVALVTGGGRGIGRAIALALAEAGAAVAITGRDAARLDATRAELAGHGVAALALPCDVADSAAVGRAFAEARAQLGPISILVNNAGITASVKFAEMDDATWDRIMRVNAAGPFYCCRAAVPDMIAGGWGRIINIASYAGLSGIAYSSAYSASKHALIGLTRSLALELGRAGVRANAICPGWVETDMVHDAVANIVAKTGRAEADARASMLALAGQQRMIAPEEVAAVALRLAGPEGDAVNGQALTIE
ncbi:SDR family NAD(P)-dependent oxidoreductase [Kouleothrix sp.]|uniref:SDR family NAD(P)-dependent oxidoreductase n=1 Tax=Kouleothrix sp. TaxID=2779161 RepID=UPI003918F75C